MALRIAICDDEEVHRKRAATIAKAWAKERGEAIELFLYETGEGFLFAWSNNPVFDVLFLDIRMGGMNGMTVAEKVRQTDSELHIIFVTGMLDYALKGYEVQALRYILKPLQQKAMITCLDRVLSLSGSQKQAVFLFKNDGEQRRVAFSDIMYFDVEGHYVTLHTPTEKYAFKKRFNELEQELPRDFVRFQRSMIINLRYVFALRPGELTLDNAQKSVFAVSANRQDFLNQQFMRYHRGE